MRSDPGNEERGTPILFADRHLERFDDRVTNVAENAVDSVTGGMLDFDA